jgi:hypothetical protein
MMINIDQVVDNIGNYIINFSNEKNLSLNEVFTLSLKKYNISNMDKNKILVKVISYISNSGYDIVSTHPLRFKKYK